MQATLKWLLSLACILFLAVMFLGTAAPVIGEGLAKAILWFALFWKSWDYWINEE